MLFRHGKNNTRNYHILATKSKPTGVYTAVCGYWAHGPQVIEVPTRQAETGVCPECRRKERIGMSNELPK